MFSCDKTLGPPKNVLSERKMVSIMADLHVAEARVKAQSVSQDSARHLYSIYELQILDKHNVSPEKYLHSYQYYLDNHRLMTRVHQATLDTLTERQRKLEAMPDSLFDRPKPVQEVSSLQEEPVAADSVQNNATPADTSELITPVPMLEEDINALKRRRKKER
ncbi:hypothetical protein D770_06325 [Flammeovirgaceae bacterium 311]|nr:hypothetical protein D770_06325 [Flammeovirgaceae bacterium 311]